MSGLILGLLLAGSPLWAQEPPEEPSEEMEQPLRLRWRLDPAVSKGLVGYALALGLGRMAIGVVSIGAPTAGSWFLGFPPDQDNNTARLMGGLLAPESSGSGVWCSGGSTTSPLCGELFCSMR
jgi:hypothetical protein